MVIKTNKHDLNIFKSITYDGYNLNAFMEYVAVVHKTQVKDLLAGFNLVSEHINQKNPQIVYNSQGNMANFHLNLNVIPRRFMICRFVSKIVKNLISCTKQLLQL